MRKQHSVGGSHARWDLPAGTYLALLSHSGSRGTGAAICNHFSALARNLRPTVVVLDQLESLCGRDHQGEPAARRVRNELLAELDDPRNAGVLVVGTTRDPADVDPALLREGRIGVHLEVPALSRDDRSAVLAGHLATFDLPAPTTTAVATCFDRMDGGSGARIELLAQLAALHPEEDLMRLIDDMEKG